MKHDDVACASFSRELDIDPVFDAFRACPPPPMAERFPTPLLRALQEIRESGRHPTMSWDPLPFTFARKTGRPWPETGRA